MAVVVGLTACDSSIDVDAGVPPVEWEVQTADEPGALLAIWGQSSTDVWVVGADARDGTGPTVLHVTDGQIARINTGQTEGDLWWVYGFANGPIFMGGSGGLILRYDGEETGFTTLTTPDTRTVFGLWGATPEGMWAVGGSANGAGGFAWRLNGDVFSAEPSLPETVEESGAIWKVHGTSANDAWLVGSNGISLHWTGTELQLGDTGVGSSLFTVYGNAERYVAVGGEVTGIIVEKAGDAWVDASPEDRTPFLTGVALGADGSGVAVGAYGLIMDRTDSGWQEAAVEIPTDEDLHGVWIDPDGGAWVAGGHTSSAPMTSGVLLYRPAQ